MMIFFETDALPGAGCWIFPVRKEAGGSSSCGNHFCPKPPPTEWAGAISLGQQTKNICVKMSTCAHSCPNPFSPPFFLPCLFCGLCLIKAPFCVLLGLVGCISNNLVLFICFIYLLSVLFALKMNKAFLACVMWYSPVLLLPLDNKQSGN